MTINGSAGALLYMDGEIDHTPIMAVDGEKIAAIYIVRNPTSCIMHRMRRQNRHPKVNALGARPDRLL